MRSFQKKERLKRIMQSKPFLIFLSVVILVFIFSTFSFMSKMEETIKNRKIVEDKIAELEKSKEKLNSDISKLKTEAGVEEIIRENYGVAKEGEGMIMITDDKNTETTQPKADSPGFFSFLKNLFK
jgi:cell division protein FtsB